MKIRSLRLRNFRGFRSVDLDLSADVVAIYSRNGVGKTALFDAMELALLDELHRFADAATEGPVEAYLANVFGDGTFGVAVEFDDDTEAVVKGDRNGHRERSGSHREVHDLIFKYLVSPSYEVRPKQVATIRSVFRSTHFLSQQFIANLAHVGEVKESTLATLVGSGDIQKCAERAEKVVAELSRRLRNEYGPSAIDASQTYAAAVGERQRLEVLVSSREQILERLTGTGEPSILKQMTGGTEMTELAKLDPSALSGASVAAAMEADLLVNRLSVARTLLERSETHDALAARVQTSADRVEKLQSQVEALVKRGAETRLRAEAAYSRFQESEAAARLAESQLRVLQQWHDTHEASEQRRITAGSRSAAERELAAALTSQEAKLTETRELMTASEREWRAASDDVVYLRSAVQSVEGAIVSHRRADHIVESNSAELVALADEERRLEESITALERDLETARTDLHVATLDSDIELSRVEELLAELRAHVSGSECPLCGHRYRSSRQLDEALAKMQERRSATLTASQHTRASLHERVAALSSLLGRTQQERVGVTEDLAELRTAISQADLDRAEAVRTLEAEGCDALSTEPFFENLKRRLAAVLRKQTESASALARIRETESLLTEEVLHRRRDLEDARRRTMEAVSEVGVYERTSATLRAELQIESTEQAEARLHAISTSVIRLTRQTDDARAMYSNAQQDSTESARRLADEREALVGAERELGSLRLEREALVVHYTDLGISLDADADEIRSAAASINQAYRRLIAFSDATRQLATLSAEGPLDDMLNAVREKEGQSAAAVEEATTRRDAAQSALSRARAWIEPLRNSVTSAVTTFIDPHRDTINQLFRRLVPHAHTFEEIVLRASRDGGLDLGVRYRGKEAPSGQPEFFLSTAQTNVLALSIFIAFARSQRWSELQTMLLDDPVQHLDDLDAIAFLDMLRAIVQEDTRRQIIISTCSRNLYAHIIRKFRLVEAPGLRLTAITLEDDPVHGATIRYDHGGPMHSAAVG